MKSWNRLSAVVIISALIAAVIFLVSTEDFTSAASIKEFIRLQFSIHTISLLSFFSVRIAARFRKSNSRIETLLLSIAAALCASQLAMLPISLYHMVIDGYTLAKLVSEYSFSKSFVPVIFITTALTVFFVRSEFLFQEKNFWFMQAQEKEKIISDLIETKNGYISFKESEETHKVSYSSILYISAHGRYTVIHAREGDFRTAISIRDHLKKLPPRSFIQIHKSFIANTDSVKKMRYAAGGAYYLFLNDEEESILPVGRKFAPSVKKLFKAD